MSRPDWDEYFLGIAVAVSKRATCPRRNVGALVVRDYDKRIIGSGYNGAETGKPHCIDVGCDMIKGHCKRAKHAEVNVLDYITALNPRIRHTMYTTVSPCEDCLTQINKWPIFRIVYLEPYSVDHEMKNKEYIKLGEGHEFTFRERKNSNQ